MKPFLIVIFILKGIYCQYESEIILRLTENLEIRQCFFLFEDVNNTNLLSRKKDLLKNIAVAYISFEQLLDYHQIENSNGRIAVIFDENRLDWLEETSQNLHLVSIGNY